jgi:hypothetical protein
MALAFRLFWKEACSHRFDTYPAVLYVMGSGFMGLDKTLDPSRGVA